MISIKENIDMKKWYRDMTKAQKIFVYFVSIALVSVFGIGLIPLAVLIYLGLGNRDSDRDNLQQ